MKPVSIAHETIGVAFMASAIACAVGNYLGFETTVALKEHVVLRNRKLIGKATVALVKDRCGGNPNQFHVILRRATGDTLYLVLPDSKELCFARVRQERTDVPFLFEVLA